jgi:putative phosphoribosyl transferase
MPDSAARHEIEIRDESVELTGDLTLPSPCLGIVIFAHGSGSSRRSSRNRMVAGELVRHSCATLLFDLLTDEEAADRRNVFDIELLAKRLLASSANMHELSQTSALPQAYFGASTGAAAALVAAAQSTRVSDHEPPVAVVSRGGRPDLADEHLGRVPCPTLLLVGSLDHQVLELNREAQRLLQAPNMLDIIEGATHLFEEPGTLEEVAHRAAQWFMQAFQRASSTARH